MNYSLSFGEAIEIPQWIEVFDDELILEKAGFRVGLFVVESGYSHFSSEVWPEYNQNKLMRYFLNEKVNPFLQNSVFSYRFNFCKQ